MNKLSRSESQAIIARSIGNVKSETGWDDGRIIDEYFNFFNNYDLSEQLYQPDRTLSDRIGQYINWCNGERDEDPGQLMEELAYLAFRCIQGVEVIKSFQSYAAQHDLMISGSSPTWIMLMKFLQLDNEHRTIVVEAKNESSPISDAQFSRLCSIVQNKFSHCRLGIFFSRRSASGFPDRISEQQARQRSLRDARATQVLFRASSGKFVIVLDHHDILCLSQPGSLPRLLEAKIRDVDEASGIPLDFEEDWNEVDLPPHLAQYLA